MPVRRSSMSRRRQSTRPRLVPSPRESFEALERRDLLAVVIWDGGPRGTGVDWNVATNWVGDRAPTARDDVVIGDGFRNATIVHGSGATQVNSIRSEAALQVANSQLSVSSSSQVAGLQLDPGGVLAGGDGRSEAAVRVVDAMNWLGGSLTSTSPGVAGLRLIVDGRLTIDGRDPKVLQDATLVSRGVAKLDGTGSVSVESAVLQNEGRWETSGAPSILPVANSGSSRVINAAGGQWLHRTAGARQRFEVPFENWGSLTIESGELVAARSFRQQDGTTELSGGTLRGDGVTVEISRGALTGEGTVEANVFNHSGTVAPGSPIGRLTVNGNYSQNAGATLQVDIGGPRQAIEHDHLQVTGSVTLDGTLDVALTDRFVLDAGANYVPLTYRSARNQFRTVTSSNEFDVSLDYQLNALNLRVDRNGGEADAATARDALNTELTRLAEQAPAWGAGFDRASVDLPVVVEQLGSLFGLQDAGGPLQAIGDILPVNLPSSLANLDQLQSALDALEGFSVICVQGQPGCSSNDLIQVQFDHQVTGLEATGDFHDTTNQHLAELAAAADVDGALDYLGDLTTRLVFGVDTDGFFVRGDSLIELHVFAAGNVTTSYDLQFPGLSVDAAPSSEATADFVLSLSAGGVGNRLRDASLNHLLDALTLNTHGTAGVNLQLELATGAETVLGFGGNFTIPVEDNTIGSIDTQFAYPSVNDFYQAVIPLIQAGYEELFGDSLAGLLQSIPLPLADLVAAEFQEARARDATRLFDDIETDWFHFVSFLKGFWNLATFQADGQGLFYTRGDEVLRSNEVRDIWGVDGEGVTIGVISNGLEGQRLAQLSGDLPESSRLLFDPAYFGVGGEGTAMLEIIHDIAPAATLAFASGIDPANRDHTTYFNSAVDWLVNVAQADIIVDDLGFVDEEPMFADGGNPSASVAAHIQDVIDNHTRDVLFVTSAGNDADRHFQTVFDPITVRLSGETTDRILHRFADGNHFTRIDLSTRRRGRWMTMQWSDDFFAPTGEYRLLLIDPVTNQLLTDAAGNPAISRSKFVAGSRLAVSDWGVPLPSPGPFALAIEEVASNSFNLFPTIEIIHGYGVDLGNQNDPADSIYGHPALLDMLTVGSIDLDGSTCSTRDPKVDPDHRLPATYSSHGPSTVNVVEGVTETRPSLDVMGIDGVEVSGFGFLNRQFCGTSAAAPHVAGVAALLSELVPDLTSDELRAVLAESAVPLVNGIEYIDGWGHGRVDAIAAANLLAPFPTEANLATAAVAAEANQEGPIGLELLERLGLTIHETLNQADLVQLMQGNPLEPGTNLLNATFSLQPGDVPALEYDYDFGFQFGAPGSLASVAVEDGNVGVKVVPTADIHFGIDTEGFYFEPATALGGQLTATAEGTGRWDGFGLRLAGVTTLEPSITFDETASQRIRLSEVIPHVLEKTDVTLGNLTGTIQTDLILDYLDYVDVDGIPTNNSAQGGDPFTVRGTATVSANLDSFDVNDLGDFRYEFSDIALKNPDIDDDGAHDFTVSVLGQNLIELAKDLLRGDRALLSFDLAGPFSAVVTPLVESSLGEWLGLQAALDTFLEDAEQEPEPVEAADGTNAPLAAEGDLFDVSVADDLLDIFQSIFQGGLPETPVNLAALTINLDRIPLDVIDENVNFDLQSLLPDTVDVEGRAGIENAFLQGQLIFGVDTSLNPLYLLTDGPAGSTTLEGGFEIYVNVTGEPLGDGLLTLQAADARVSPRFLFDFSGIAGGKLRLGPDLFGLTDVAIGLEDEQYLKLRADGLSVSPGPLTASASDDIDNDEIPAVEGTIDLDTGQIDLTARKLTVGLADVVTVEALPMLNATTEEVEPGLTLSYQPGASPELPLLSTPQLKATFDALAINGLAPEISIEGLQVDHGRQVLVGAAEVTFPEDYLVATGLAGILPIQLDRIRIDFPDPSDLNQFTLCTTGRVLVDELGDTIESAFGTPVTPIVSVGSAETTCDAATPVQPGQFDFLLNIDALIEGRIEPINLGPITLGLADLQVAGTVLDGQITLGGYQNGDWSPLLDGFFIFQTDDSDPTDDDYANLTIEIDSSQSSLIFDNDSASLQIAASVQLDAGISGEFGDLTAGADLGLNLHVEAARTEPFPYVAVTEFEASLGAISIDSLVIRFDEILQLTASNIALIPNPGPAQPIATIGSMSVEILAFQDASGNPLPGFDLQQAAVSLSDVELYSDRLVLGSTIFELSGSLGPESDPFLNLAARNSKSVTCRLNLRASIPWAARRLSSATSRPTISASDSSKRNCCPTAMAPAWPPSPD